MSLPASVSSPVFYAPWRQHADLLFSVIYLKIAVCSLMVAVEALCITNKDLLSYLGCLSTSLPHPWRGGGESFSNFSKFVGLVSKIQTFTLVYALKIIWILNLFSSDCDRSNQWRKVRLKVLCLSYIASLVSIQIVLTRKTTRPGQ